MTHTFTGGGKGSPAATSDSATGGAASRCKVVTISVAQSTSKTQGADSTVVERKVLPPNRVCEMQLRQLVAANVLMRRQRLSVAARRAFGITTGGPLKDQVLAIAEQAIVDRYWQDMARKDATIAQQAETIRALVRGGDHDGPGAMRRAA